MSEVLTDYSGFENEDEFELESGFGEGELNSGGGMNGEGFFHFEVVDSQRVVEEGKVPVHKLDLKILEGTNKSQIGKVCYHRMNLAKAVYENDQFVGVEPLTPGARKMLFKFFVGIGLLKQEDVEGKEKVKLPFGKLLGCQGICEIKNEPYVDRTGQKKDSFKIPYGCNVWTLDDESKKDVPRDPESLAMLAASGGIGDIEDI